MDCAGEQLGSRSIWASVRMKSEGCVEGLSQLSLIIGHRLNATIWSGAFAVVPRGRRISRPKVQEERK